MKSLSGQIDMHQRGRFIVILKQAKLLRIKCLLRLIKFEVS